MPAMQRPVPVEVVVSPSRIAIAWTLALAIATFVVTLTLPFAWWIHIVDAVLLASWTGWKLRELRRGRHAICRLRVDGDRRILLTRSDGRSMRGRILPSTYVGARLTTLVWRPSDRQFAHAECLLPDMLSAEDFRRLRVLLRYGRSEATHGAPPSHA